MLESSTKSEDDMRAVPSISIGNPHRAELRGNIDKSIRERSSTGNGKSNRPRPKMNKSKSVQAKDRANMENPASVKSKMERDNPIRPRPKMEIAKSDQP